MCLCGMVDWWACILELIAKISANCVVLMHIYRCVFPRARTWREGVKARSALWDQKFGYQDELNV